MTHAMGRERRHRFLAAGASAVLPCGDRALSADERARLHATTPRTRQNEEDDAHSTREAGRLPHTFLPSYRQTALQQYLIARTISLPAGVRAIIFIAARRSPSSMHDDSSAFEDAARQQKASFLARLLTISVEVTRAIFSPSGLYYLRGFSHDGHQPSISSPRPWPAHWSHRASAAARRDRRVLDEPKRAFHGRT